MRTLLKNKLTGIKESKQRPKNIYDITTQKDKGLIKTADIVVCYKNGLYYVYINDFKVFNNKKVCKNLEELNQFISDLKEQQIIQ